MAVVALWLLAATRAAAQVNVEGLRKELSGDGVLGRVNGSLTSYRGNTVGLELGVTGFVAWRSAPHLAFASTAANYSHLGGADQVANAFAHLRYVRALEDWVSAETFVQAENDRFRSLRLRALVGLGLRFALLDQETVGLYYGASYMFEHDTLKATVVPVRPAEVHRFNNYASLVFVLDPKRATLSNTIYVQPRFDDVRDLRLLDDVSFDVTVTGRVSAGVHASLRWESPVRSPVKRADLVVKNTLGVLF
jgi:Protein of unknown function, DUF481